MSPAQPTTPAEASGLVRIVAGLAAVALTLAVLAISFIGVFVAASETEDPTNSGGAAIAFGLVAAALSAGVAYSAHVALTGRTSSPGLPLLLAGPTLYLLLIAAIVVD